MGDARLVLDGENRSVGVSVPAYKQKLSETLSADGRDPRLSSQRSSQVVADVGFGSTVALSFAFRQVTKMTPTAFLHHLPVLVVPPT
jgi:hypothetical protein